MSFSNESSTTTLVADAAAVDVLTLGAGPIAINLDYIASAVAVQVALKVKNVSAVFPASVTATLQVRLDSGTWADVRSETIEMHGGDPAKHASLIAMAPEAPVSGHTSIDVRLQAACTGADVVLDTNWIVRDGTENPR